MGYVRGEGLTEDCIVWIHGHLVLGRIANETLRLRKGYIARCGPVALIVGNDLHFAMLKDPDARVRGAKINANRWYLGHLCGGFNNRPEVGGATMSRPDNGSDTHRHRHQVERKERERNANIIFTYVNQMWLHNLNLNQILT